MTVQALATATPIERPAVAPAVTVDEVAALYALPFMDLVFRAAAVHRQHFDPAAVQRSSLLSVKTGGCSEDCGYCSQSKRREAEIREKEFKLENAGLMPLAEVVAAAKVAKANGASRFCMGAAWRGPKDRDLDRVKDMVREVKALGLETCVTLGMLKEGQAEELKEAGLDYYNHNLDTAPEYYTKIVTTHSQDDRVDTLGKVRGAGLKVCSGGIIGMGESRTNRAALIAKLANLNPAPESVPINNLVPIPGTPLEDQQGVDAFEFIRTIAVARIVMPTSYVRLSAGRQQLSDEGQALAFLAGANSIFYGEQLLTTGNPDVANDESLFQRLDLKAI